HHGFLGSKSCGETFGRIFPGLADAPLVLGEDTRAEAKAALGVAGGAPHALDADRIDADSHHHRSIPADPACLARTARAARRDVARLGFALGMRAAAFEPQVRAVDVMIDEVPRKQRVLGIFAMHERVEVERDGRIFTATDLAELL